MHYNALRGKEGVTADTDWEKKLTARVGLREGPYTGWKGSTPSRHVNVKRVTSAIPNQSVAVRVQGIVNAAFSRRSAFALL